MKSKNQITDKKHTNNCVNVELKGQTIHNCFECLKKLVNFIYSQDILIDVEHVSHLFDYCKLLDITNSIIDLLNGIDGGNEHSLNNEISIKTEPCNGTEDNVKLPGVCIVDFKNESKCMSPNSMLGIINDIPTSHSDQEEFGNDFDKSNNHEEKVFIKLPTGRTHNCIGCKFKSYRCHDLLSHIRLTGHGGNVCSLCWIEEDNKQNLIKHIKLHEFPKPFFCTYCDSRFQTRSLLGQHLPTHLREKPYICPHCQKCFKRKHGLNCHLEIHSNEKKHLCDECGFSTTHARILRAHKLTHSGDVFRCSYPGCAHTSIRKENMNRHVETHSNDKPFVCELCGQKFSLTRSLRRHSLMHSKSDMNNICPHCPFKTRRVDNLKAHIFRKHTDNPPKTEFFETGIASFMDPLNNAMEHSIKRN